MKTHKIYAMGLLLAAQMGGCKWSDFSDLEGETWVRLVEPPEDAGGSEWGNGLGSSKAGEPFMVTGRNDGGRVSMMYWDGTAVRDKATRTLDITSSRVVPAVSPNGKILAAANSNGQALVWKDNLLNDAMVATGAVTFAVGDDGTLASLDAMNKLRVGDAAAVQCAAGDPIVALRARGTEDGHPWLGWTTTGKLLRLKNDCTSAVIATGIGAPSMPAAAGSEAGSPNAAMVVLGARTYLAQFGDQGKVFVVENNAIIAQRDAPKLAAMTAAEFDGKVYLATGFPEEVIDGTVTGRVKLWSVGSGVLAEEADLYDPELPSDQKFGLALGSYELNGRPVLVVGASKRIYVYLRTNLYANRIAL